MSPRPVRSRKVSNPPVIAGFKPYGGTAKENKGKIFLHFEEYEAVRLCDHEQLKHHFAAKAMGVSRPTLTRIYARARQKIARAFVEGIQIIIEGGKVHFDSEWYSCASCGCYFNHPEKNEIIHKCPLCGSHQVTSNKELNENSDL